MKVKDLIICLLSLILMSFTSVKVMNKLEKKAHRIHSQCLTVDTHCDTPMLMLKTDFNLREEHTSPHSRVDLPRMKSGGLDAMFFGVFTGQKPRTDENYMKTYAIANKMLDSIHSMVKGNSDLATLALRADDLEKISKAGKRAIYIGMENGFPLAKDINRVEEFYNKGVRYITLCHSYHNDICDSSSDSAPVEHNGLSSFGKEVIAEMNRLGMMVDVSHISDKSFYDVMELSNAPVIASHSSVRSVALHNRNMTDEMIKKLAEKKGVIQICLLDVYIKEPDTTSPKFLAERRLYKIYKTTYNSMTEAEKAAFEKEWDDVQSSYTEELPTIKDMVNHIDYVRDLVGIDYVGIGSDFDGGGGLRDCADVSDFPAITVELVRRGYSESDIHKIWGGNLLRVFREVERCAGKAEIFPSL